MVINRFKNEYLSWAVLMGIVIFVLEFLFFNKGIIFTLIIPLGIMLYGWKSMDISWGKNYFLIGGFLLIVNFFSMMTFKFFVLAVIIHLVIQFAQSKGNPTIIRPEIKKDMPKEEAVLKKQPIFKAKLFGEKRTPEHVYEWKDVNIQAGVGDTVIDLTNTVLPKGETVIFIRNIVGNIDIRLPYDIEVCINHSSIIGNLRFFHIEEEKVFNQSVIYQTEGYEEAEQRVKVFTSLMIGDLEVKRA